MPNARTTNATSARNLVVLKMPFPLLCLPEHDPRRVKQEYGSSSCTPLIEISLPKSTTATQNAPLFTTLSLFLAKIHVCLMRSFR